MNDPFKTDVPLEEPTDVYVDGIKHDSDKPRMDYLPWGALRLVADIMTYGAKKYTPDNWKTIKDIGRYEAAMLRHYSAWKQGKECDKESGRHHLAHMATNALFILALTEDKND